MWAEPCSIKPRAQLRVLIADDNRDQADSTALLVQTWEHLVAVAYEGRQTLRQARLFRPDVVLLDMAMPLLDGYEVARSLRRQRATRHLTLIAITGQDEEHQRHRAWEAGVDLLLAKPVEPLWLQTTLTLLLPAGPSEPDRASPNRWLLDHLRTALERPGR